MPPLTEPAFWVLTALAEGPLHGYAVLKRVGELSGGTTSLRVTTLYATLDRLSQQGLVRLVSEEVVDGRARRTYEITPDGRGQLTAEAERLLARARAAQQQLQARPQLGHALVTTS
ncbi:transcriptional regulator, PadR family [Quadrisphaera granulorum]|uniref:PadR family transcriptional regulator n=1 Tax=Quadrisphaera granulorum TaxID=317664 RepID=A0A315ZQ47_9ACTN|nr:PadR family transcriptional regulator [Quadrisphaera granulorum]PWJ47715.1 PadR family transcriptional regulator [Quadrisphaera granulorum]SZE98669.1 transcriptional regulator, PadR family [Quadrisphaera granulorum]